MRTLLLLLSAALASRAATSYSNTGGSGDRTTWLMVQGSGSLCEGGSQLLLSATSTNAYGFGFGGAAGCALTFDFGSNRVVDEATWGQAGNNSTGGTWKWQGSTDGTSYTDIGSSFTLGGSASQVQTQLNGNTTAYRYYRLQGVSGFTNDGAAGYNILFKVDAAPVQGFFNTYGAGDRTATVTVTQASIINGGTLSNLVRSSYKTDSTSTFVSHALTSADTITFQFPTSQIVDEIVYGLSGANNSTTWQCQGSNNGSSFTNIGSPTAVTFPVAGSSNQGMNRFDGCNGNTTGYLYYRMTGSSGTPSNVPNLRTFMFRTSAGPPSTANKRSGMIM